MNKILTPDDRRFLWRWFKNWAIGSAVAIVILTAPTKSHGVNLMGNSDKWAGPDMGNVRGPGCTCGFWSTIGAGVARFFMWESYF